MTHKCIHCLKIFSTNYILNKHQLSAKYCLKIQEEKRLTTENKCKYCSSNVLLSELMIHQIICADEKINDLTFQLGVEKEKLILVNSMLEEKIKTSNKEHELTITKLGDKQTMMSNCGNKYISLNSLDLSEDKIKLAVGDYTIDHYNRSCEGMVDWCVNSLLKDENNNLLYLCSDKNRRNFMFKNKDGEVISDSNADKLKKAIKPIINDKLKYCKKEVYTKLGECSDDENEKLDKCVEIHESNKNMGVEFEIELAKKTYKPNEKKTK